MSPIHKNYGIEFVNIIRDGRFHKNVNPINYSSDKAIIPLLYMLIVHGVYDGLDNTISEISNVISNQTSYYGYYDFVEVTIEDSTVTISYETSSGGESIMPQQDFLSILLELREFVDQAPLDGQLV